MCNQFCTIIYIYLKSRIESLVRIKMGSPVKNILLISHLCLAILEISASFAAIVIIFITSYPRKPISLYKSCIS